MRPSWHIHDLENEDDDYDDHHHENDDDNIRYQSGPLDMMNLSEGRAPHEAVTRVKQLEAVSLINTTS